MSNKTYRFVKKDLYVPLTYDEKGEVFYWVNGKSSKTTITQSEIAPEWRLPEEGE